MKSIDTATVAWATHHCVVHGAEAARTGLISTAGNRLHDYAPPTSGYRRRSSTYCPHQVVEFSVTSRDIGVLRRYACWTMSSGQRAASYGFKFRLQRRRREASRWRPASVGRPQSQGHPDPNAFRLARESRHRRAEPDEEREGDEPVTRSSLLSPVPEQRITRTNTCAYEATAGDGLRLAPRPAGPRRDRSSRAGRTKGLGLVGLVKRGRDRTPSAGDEPRRRAR